MLDEACRAAQAWPQLRLSVNVSAVQLSRPEFAAQLFGVLDSTGMTTQRLELELTETALLHENEQVQLNIEQLYRRGIGITIDDFGAGVFQPVPVAGALGARRQARPLADQ